MKEAKDSQDQQHSTHGVFMVVFGQGILIQGKPGIGKSDLALNLLDRGHTLVSDDLVIFNQSYCGDLIGYALKPSKRKIYIRNLGVLELESEYRWVGEHKLDKIVWLSDEHTLDSALPSVEEAAILDKKIPLFRLTIGQNRPLALLVEMIAKMNEPLREAYE